MPFKCEKEHKTSFSVPRQIQIEYKRKPQGRPKRIKTKVMQSTS